jgi:hypothetical protein
MSKPTSSVIYTKLNTSISDFNNLVQELGPPSKTSEQIEFPNLSFQAYITDLNATQLQTAQSNPIVQVVAEDLQFVDDTSTDFDGTPLSKRHRRDYTRNIRTGLKIERIPAMADNANNNFSMLLKRDTIMTQSNSPSHLKLISQPSGASGTVPDYTYDSAAAGRGVTVYFLDTGVRESHIVRGWFNYYRPLFLPGLTSIARNSREILLYKKLYRKQGRATRTPSSTAPPLCPPAEEHLPGSPRAQTSSW